MVFDFFREDSITQNGQKSFRDFRKILRLKPLKK